MSIQLRSAVPTDAPALLAIYAPYVEQTAITFEYDVPAEAEFTRRIADTLQNYPYLVAEQDGVPVGYAYAGKFHERAAYDWSVETSIYVEQHRKRQGIGRLLHDALEQELQRRHFLNMNACVACPIGENDPYGTAFVSMKNWGIAWWANSTSAAINSDGGITWCGWKSISAATRERRCRCCGDNFSNGFA